MSLPPIMNESQAGVVLIELPLARQRTWVAVLRWIAFIVLMAFYAYFCVTYARDALHRGFEIGLCSMWLTVGINALSGSTSSHLLCVSKTTLTLTPSHLPLLPPNPSPHNHTPYLRLHPTSL